jgi:hypothetical protein
VKFPFRRRQPVAIEQPGPATQPEAKQSDDAPVPEPYYKVEPGDGARGAPASEPESTDAAPAPRPRRPTVWQSIAARRGTILGVAVALVLGSGGAGSVFVDDVVEDLWNTSQAAPPARPDVSAYMSRAAYEWATIERLASRARQTEGRYRCDAQAARLEPLLSELGAIGSPDAALHRTVETYVQHLTGVVERCASGEFTGSQAASVFIEAQTHWNAVRLRALQLGWNTPCALHRTIRDCLEE